MHKQAIILTLQIRRISLTVKKGLPHCHSLKGLLQVALGECLAPLLVTPGVSRPAGDVPAAREVLHYLLEHGAERFTSITRVARGVTELEDLAWHNEASDVVDPCLHCGVEL